jgi:hypothetical protein
MPHALSDFQSNIPNCEALFAVRGNLQNCPMPMLHPPLFTLSLTQKLFPVLPLLCFAHAAH